MSISDLIQWLQGILTVTGLIAVLKLLYDWISKYATKQKELTDLDKETRNILKEMVDGQKALREIDKEVLGKKIEELEGKFREADEQGKKQKLTLEDLTRRNELARLGMGFQNEMLEITERIAVAPLKQNLEKLLHIVANRPELISNHDVQKVMIAALNDDPPPEDWISLAIYLTSSSVGYSERSRALFEITVDSLSILLDEYAKNPDMPIDKIANERLSERIRTYKARTISDVVK